jgi:acyl-CoA thioesterase-1
MKIKLFCLVIIVLGMMSCTAVKPVTAPVNAIDYLSDVKTGLKVQWPANRTINLVFHGHSVPSGYAKTPDVRTFDSYPYQLLALLKQQYPYAVINVIITAKGGENSIQGAQRFDKDVLIHKPDVLFIDYALNDQNIALNKTYTAWNSMIKKAVKKHIKVILLTPSPDLRVDMSDNDNPLKKNTEQVIRLANENHVGLVNSFDIFNKLYAKGDSLKKYMAQVNHPNKSGNALIADEIFKWFE